MKTITIKGKDYNIKYTIRALFIFEQITKKSFKIETTLDNYIFLYSLILANNKDNVLDWDDYLDALDEDPTLLLKLNEVVSTEDKKEKLFDDGDEDNEGSKKK